MKARAVDAAELQRALVPVFTADELRHTVPMGVVDTLNRDPGRYPNAVMWLAEQGGEARAALIRTPPFPAIVLGEPGALRFLAGAVFEAGVELPGVNGVEPGAGVFAEAWCGRTGANPQVRMRLRLHALRAVDAVPGAPGVMRHAGADDRELLLDWTREFGHESGVHATERQIALSVDDGLSRDWGAVIWDDGGPVSLSMARLTSAICARVGPVYTPPACRRRGYATALVAGHTEALLAGAATSCVLFTDRANLTSNAIYGRIGYRPVCDGVEIDFERS